MTNPIDWGGTPLANGAIRGFIAAIIAGIISVAFQVLGGAELRDAALTGVTVSGPLLLALLGYGGWDQRRASNGTVIPSDVPVQLEANLTPGPMVQGEGDHPPRTTKMTPQVVAQNMTAEFKRTMRYQRGGR